MVVYLPANDSMISFARIHQLVTFQYELIGTVVQSVDDVKDLGVILHSKLTFSQHVRFVVD